MRKIFSLIIAGLIVLLSTRSGAYATPQVVAPQSTAPQAADLDWAKTQRKAKTVVRLGYYEDETFPVCDLHIPAAHYLESWGEAEAVSGIIGLRQPTISRLAFTDGQLGSLELPGLESL